MTFCCCCFLPASDWGQCDDGISRKGCGPQEEFYNCADIAIDPEPAPSNIPNVAELTRSSPFALDEALTLPDVVTSHRVIAPSYESVAAVGSNDRNGASNINIEMGNSQFVPIDMSANGPMSFLPMEALQPGNIGPVIPKFDFFDPSVDTTTSTTVAPTTTTVETTTADKSSVVELKFNSDNVTTSLDVTDAQNATEVPPEYTSVINGQTSADVTTNSAEPTSTTLVNGVVDVTPSEASPVSADVTSRDVHVNRGGIAVNTFGN